MKIKRIFKSIKSKFRIGRGHPFLFLLGASTAFGYWSYERRGYENNITELNRHFDRVVFIGDTGEKSDIRERVIEKIFELNPTEIYLMGDLCYDDGCNSLKDFQENIKPFLKEGVETHCILGNHDHYGANKKEREWMAANSDKYGCKFENYYKGRIYTNACIAAYDSTVYYEGKEPNILKYQEEFLLKFIKDKRCEGKLFLLTGHHNIWGMGGHINDINRSHYDFVLKLRKMAKNFKYIHGHEHLMANYSGNIYTFGSGAKIDACERQPTKGFCYEKNGFGWFENDLMMPIVVE